MDKIDGLTMDIEKTEQEKLKSIFPECFVEGKLDIVKLQELCGVFQTIDENDRERYEFRWAGKQDAFRLSQQRSTGTLRPCKEESVNWDTTQNVYIEGDNLEVLKLLQSSYYRKIKMIYIDPPYNTGNDFVYKDDYADNIANYKEITSQGTTSNPETAGRYHTNWLNMMYPRLRLAKNLLRDDGVIFISIDDNEVANLRKMCDELFGEENFVGNIAWESKTKSQNTITAYNKLQPKVEHLLLYTKHDCRRFNLITKGQKDYNLSDERGEYREHVLELMNADGVRGRETMVFDISDGVSTVSLPEGKQWQLGQVQVAIYKERGDLFCRDGKVIIKMRPEDERTEVTEPFWGFFSKEIGTAESAKKELSKILDNHGFETVKPLELIKRLVYHTTEKDSIILDFFSGSATTAHAVMQLNAEDGGNRKFIMVQLPELTNNEQYPTICEIGKERIRRAGKKIHNSQFTIHNEKQANDNNYELSIMHYELDIGFKVFKLDTSNLKLWDNTYTNDGDELLSRMENMLDLIKPERSELDIVYEVLLKLGQPLTSIVTPLDINGKTVYSVGEENVFIICLAENITPEDAEKMAEYLPGRIVFADECFPNTEAKSNVKHVLQDKGITLKLI